MVKVELGPNTQKPQRARITTKHLPPELMAEGDWQNYFVPALLSWLGSQEEVWSNDDSAIADAIITIGHSHCGNGYQLTMMGTKYVEVAQVSILLLLFMLCNFTLPLSPARQALQRISEWRNSFGSTAIWALHHWFDDQSEFCESDTN